LTFAVIPAGVALVGAAIAAFRAPSPRIRTYVEHFAAGVVAAVAAAELLPAALKGRSAIAIAIGFGLGTVAMLLISHFSEGAGAEEEAPPSPALPGRAGDFLAKGSAMGMVAPVAVDVLIDGFLLGLAFVAGQKAGALLAVGFALEMLSLGLATSATCRRYGWSVVRTLGSVGGIGACFIVGAGLAASLLGGLSGPWLAGVISFGLAALLYLVTEELLVEAHEVKETHPATAMFFVGFLVLIIIDVIS
jgi:ZIP family zinc transporter